MSRRTVIEPFLCKLFLILVEVLWFDTVVPAKAYAFETLIQRWASPQPLRARIGTRKQLGFAGQAPSSDCRPDYRFRES